MKNLIFVVLVAPFAIGCGSNSNNMNNSNPDMAQPAQNPDLAPTCFSGTPASNADFLNACTTAASIDIEPFYPANAPNGVLPPLQ